MEKERERRTTMKEKTARLLDLPAQTAGSPPALTLTGDRDLYLERYRGVLAYGREEIHVDGGQWVLRVRGRGLEITAMRRGSSGCPAASTAWSWYEGPAGLAPGVGFRHRGGTEPGGVSEPLRRPGG